MHAVYLDGRRWMPQEIPFAMKQSSRGAKSVPPVICQLGNQCLSHWTGQAHPWDSIDFCFVCFVGKVCLMITNVLIFDANLHTGTSAHLSSRGLYAKEYLMTSELRYIKTPRPTILLALSSFMIMLLLLLLSLSLSHIVHDHELPVLNYVGMASGCGVCRIHTAASRILYSGHRPCLQRQNSHQAIHSLLLRCLSSCFLEYKRFKSLHLVHFALFLVCTNSSPKGFMRFQPLVAA